MRCKQCDGDASEPDHARRCDGQQGKVDAQEPPDGVTRTTDEAMAVLASTRRWLIDEARAIAHDQIHHNGNTHSRAVLAEMEARGMLRRAGNIKDFWLGAVFRTAEFRWTGRWYRYSDGKVSTARGRRRNIHERTIRVWTLMTPKRKPAAGRRRRRLTQERLPFEASGLALMR